MMSLRSESEQLHILLPEMFPQLPEFPEVLEANRGQLLGGRDWSNVITKKATIEN